MDNPDKSGLYLACVNNNPWWTICRFAKYEDGVCEWQMQNNAVDIARKYGDYVKFWQEFPIKFTERFGDDGYNPPDGSVCVVKLISNKYEDDGFVIAKFNNYEFTCVFPYDDWQKDYDDWQFIEWAVIEQPLVKKG